MLMVSETGEKIFVVIKNSPFYFQLGTTSGKIDFNQIAFEATLVYDCDGFKAVDFVKNKPFDFKSNPGENGQILDVEIRIKVLTSQHEDMLFRVKISGYHPLSRGTELPGMTILSPPIKVISKPEQLRKKKQPQQQQGPIVPSLPSLLSGPNVGVSSSTPISAPMTQPNISSSKKRSLTEILMDVVSRIEQKQSDQQKVIERMLEQQSVQATALDMSSRKVPKVDPLSIFCWSDTDFGNIVNPLSLLSSGDHLSSNDNANPTTTTTTTTTTNSTTLSSSSHHHETPDFEVAFLNLLKSYQQLAPEQRSAAIRGALRESNAKEVEKISEILDLFWSEGFQNQNSRTTTTLLSDSGVFQTTDNFSDKHDPDNCTCVDCPHKQELERIDEFYRDFLSQNNQNLNFSFDPNA